MKKLIIITTALLSLMLTSCFHSYIEPETDENAVLLLQVDYLTNKFEEGQILTVDSASTFNIRTEITIPGDVNHVSLYYNEINALLFSGTSIWMGTGARTYPTELTPASEFDRVMTSDYVFPELGFQIVPTIISDTLYTSFEPAWSDVQSLVKVREFLKSNPHTTVKVFLYIPTLDWGGQSTWKWLFFIKN